MPTSQTPRAGGDEQNPRELCDAGLAMPAALACVPLCDGHTTANEIVARTVCQSIFSTGGSQVDVVGCVARVEQPGMRVWSSKLSSPK